MSKTPSHDWNGITDDQIKEVTCKVRDYILDEIDKQSPGPIVLKFKYRGEIAAIVASLNTVIESF
jgi:hypothetical protein